MYMALFKHFGYATMRAGENPDGNYSAAERPSGRW
jgi:hypothetical protein